MRGTIFATAILLKNICFNQQDYLEWKKNFSSLSIYVISTNTFFMKSKSTI